MANAKRETSVLKAIHALYPDCVTATVDATDMSYVAYNADMEEMVIDDAAIQVLIDEREAVGGPLVLEAIRNDREMRLAASDWMASGDRTMTAEEAAYRQALRDLPANCSEAYLDDNGNVVGFTWPELP